MRTERRSSRRKKNKYDKCEKMVDFAFAEHVILSQVYVLQSEY